MEQDFVKKDFMNENKQQLGKTENAKNQNYLRDKIFRNLWKMICFP